MTTFYLTVGTDPNASTITMLDAANRFVDLATWPLDGAALPSNESTDHVLQLQSGSSWVSIYVSDGGTTTEVRESYLLLPWKSPDVLRVDVWFDKLELGYALELTRDEQTAKAKTITKINKIVGENAQSTDPAQSPGGHGTFDWLAPMSRPALVRGFLAATDKLIDAGIGLPPETSDVLAALSRHGNEHAKGLSRRAGNERDVMSEATLSSRGNSAAHKPDNRRR